MKILPHMSFSEYIKNFNKPGKYHWEEKKYISYRKMPSNFNLLKYGVSAFIVRTKMNHSILI